MGMLRTLTRTFGIAGADANYAGDAGKIPGAVSGIAGPLVFQAAGSGPVTDPWARRIVELADGKSITEISEIIYGEELRAGAWLADIGMWRHLLYQDLSRTIGELARRGHVRLKSSG